VRIKSEFGVCKKLHPPITIMKLGNVQRMRSVKAIPEYDNAYGFSFFYYWGDINELDKICQVVIKNCHFNIYLFIRVIFMFFRVIFMLLLFVVRVIITICLFVLFSCYYYSFVLLLLFVCSCYFH
jgi:hypothetical protein